jgi:hypothetical protein
VTDALANAIDDVDQGVHVGSVEAAAEIASGRRIGNALGPERVEIDFILATQFEVLQTRAIAQRVVGQIKHVIGLVVRQMDFEQMQLLIDCVDETDASSQQMKSADTAMGQTAATVGDLILNVGGSEHRLVQIAQSFLVEPAFHSVLAIGELSVYLGVHSKSLSDGVDDGVDTSSDAAESQRISSFFRSWLAETRGVRLIKV